jgi:hypothetical protein
VVDRVGSADDDERGIRRLASQPGTDLSGDHADGEVHVDAGAEHPAADPTWNRLASLVELKRYLVVDPVGVEELILDHMNRVQARLPVLCLGGCPAHGRGTCGGAVDAHQDRPGARCSGHDNGTSEGTTRTGPFISRSSKVQARGRTVVGNDSV